MNRQAFWFAFLLPLLPYPLQGQPAGANASPGLIRFAAALRVAPEGSGPFTIAVERREGSQGMVSVRYTLSSGTAREGEDFLPFSGTLTFEDGESGPKILTLPVLDDSLPEGDETLILTLADPDGGAVLAAPRRARIEIRDDDTSSPLLLGAGEPFDVETGSYYPFDWMEHPSVAVLAQGGMVAAWSRWHDRFQFLPEHGSRVYGRGGGVIASSIWFSEGSSRIRFAPHPGGGFTMTGTAYTLHPLGSLGNFGQRFDASGRPLAKPYPLSQAPWAIAPGRSGRLFAIMVSFNDPDWTFSLYRYGRWGQALGSLVISTAAGRVSLASDSQGRGIVTWTESPQGPLLVRRVGAAGRWLGEAFEVDPDPERRAADISVAAAPDGRFVVVWEGASDGSGYGVFGRRFNADGQPMGPVFQVNSQIEGNQLSPRVAVQGDGRFLVVWQSPFSPWRSRIHGQYFSADGSRLGSEMLVSDNDWGQSEAEPAVAVNDGGHYAVVWRRFEDPDAISCRFFKAP